MDAANTTRNTKESDMKTYEARIFERAEHWSFDTTVKAESIEAARAQLAKQYPAKEYRIEAICRGQ